MTQYLIKFTAVPSRKYNQLDNYDKPIWTKVFVFGKIEIHVPDVADYPIHIRHIKTNTVQELGILVEYRIDHNEAD